MDATRISVARLVELGVGVTWREAGAVVFEAITIARRAGGSGSVPNPASSCSLTRGGKVELADDAANAAPESLLPILDPLLTNCVDSDRLGRAHAAGHALTFLTELGERTNAQRRRVEIAGLALRALAAEADLAMAQRPASAPLSSARHVAPVPKARPVQRPARSEPVEPVLRPTPTPSAAVAVGPGDRGRPQPEAPQPRPAPAVRLGSTPPLERTEGPESEGALELFASEATIAEPDGSRAAQRPWPRAALPRPAGAAAPPAASTGVAARVSPPASPPPPPPSPSPSAPAPPPAPAPASTPTVRDSRRPRHDAVGLPLNVETQPRRGATHLGDGSTRFWAGVAIAMGMLAVIAAWWLMFAPTTRAPRDTPSAAAPTGTADGSFTPKREAPASAPASNPDTTSVLSSPSAGAAAPSADRSRVAEPPGTTVPATRPATPPAPGSATATPPDAFGSAANDAATARDDAIFTSSSPGVEPPEPLTPLPPGIAVLAPERSSPGVFFEVLVDRNGVVEDVKLRNSGQPADRYLAALGSARRWRFTPARLNGSTVRYALRVELPQ